MATTVRVRVAVQVGGNGKWAAHGWSGAPDEDARDIAIEMLDDTGGAEHTVWLEANVPLPLVESIEAEVV